MRWIVIVGVLIAYGCGGKKGSGASKPPETSTGPGAAGMLACQSAVRAMDAFVACAPSEDEKLVAAHFQRSSREVFTSTTPIAHDTARLTARMCLGFLEGLALDLESKKCPYTLTDDERAWLDAERRRRTPIPAEASKADRAALEIVVRLRDRACVCTAGACVDAIDAELDRQVTPLSDEATLVVREAASEIVDETMACARRVRIKAGLAEPFGPADPEVVRRLAEQIRAERDAEVAKANRPPPPPITLPDGKTLKLGDCVAIGDMFERDLCTTLFDDVAECHALGGDVKACVDELVNEYGGEDDEDDAE